MKALLLKSISLLVMITGLFFNPSSLVAQQHHGRAYYKLKHSEQLKSLSHRYKDVSQRKKAEARRVALTKGWTLSTELSNGGYEELEQLGPDGAPIYYTTYNDNVVYTSRSNALYQNGDLHLDVDGLGMYVGVWDSGKALLSHQELNGRVQNGDDAKRVSGHATHVLGTILAAGVDPKAKGVAFNAEGVSYDWSNDEAEVAQAAAEGLLLSNHSYGISAKTIPDWYFGAYIYQSKDWDEIMYNAPYYLMVTAAGNTQQYQYNEQPITGTASDAYDLLLGYAVSKNGLTVAAADKVEFDQDQNVVNAQIASFSNFGPTDDGRIKPDLTGEGVNVYSAYSDSETSYLAQSGTSMAAPGVTGALLLLQQYYKETHGDFMKAATLKGLSLHTADEAGEFPGPDARFGWGIVNTKKAANAISNVGLSSSIEETSLANGEMLQYTFQVEEGETLMASISWTDPAFSGENKGNLNDATSVLVNDLDIVVFKEGEDGEFLPWKLTASNGYKAAIKGVNNVDPFEKVEVSNASGTYIIQVSHKGTLLKSRQDFSLIVTGIKDSDCVLKTPAELKTGSIQNEKVNLVWESVDDAIYEVAYRTQSNKKGSLQEWNTVLVTENSLELTSLQQNTVYQWKVRTLCSELAESDFSKVVNFRTKFVDTMAPTTPLGLDANEVTYESLILNWEASQDNVATISYELYQDGTKIGSFDTNQAFVTGLLPEHSYDFVVVALDAAGNRSLESAVYPVKTLKKQQEIGFDNDSSFEKQSDRILVYPNPAISSIKINGLTAESDGYQIFNASGNRVAYGNGYNKAIDVSTFPPGLYVVAIEDGTKGATAKFLKD